MKFKNILILAIMLIVSGKIGYCENFRDFSDTKWGFKTKYPVSWMARSMPHSKDLVKADFSSKDKTGGVQVRIYPNAGKDFETFCNWYVAQFVKDMEKRWGGKMKILENRKGKIGKNEGQIIVYDFKRGDGKRFYLINHLWPNDKRVYLFQSGCPFERKDHFNPIVSAMAEAFDFIK